MCGPITGPRAVFAIAVATAVTRTALGSVGTAFAIARPMIAVWTLASARASMVVRTRVTAPLATVSALAMRTRIGRAITIVGHGPAFAATFVRTFIAARAGPVALAVPAAFVGSWAFGRGGDTLAGRQWIVRTAIAAPAGFEVAARCPARRFGCSIALIGFRTTRATVVEARPLRTPAFAVATIVAAVAVIARAIAVISAARCEVARTIATRPTTLTARSAG